MKFFAFIAGFFRATADESSTRLVGIAAFLTACGLAVYMVVAGRTSPEDQVVMGQCFTFGCIALGLRKSSEIVETKTVTTPTVVQETEVKVSGAG